jgi:phosphohistidine phosphatase SixA
VRALELRRHAEREKTEDRLTGEGRAHALEIGRGLTGDYRRVFVSPAARAAETALWFERGSGRRFPEAEVVPGLSSDVEQRWRAAGRAAGSSRLSALRSQDPELVENESKRLADVLRDLLALVMENDRALAVGHSPLIEAAVLGLTGREIEPLRECEGVLLTEETGAFIVEDLRLDR